MKGRRRWWVAAIAVDLVLWAALFAIPVVILLLPNQWQGDSPTVPVDIVIRETLAQGAPPVATAALTLLVTLIVVGVSRWTPRPARIPADDAEAEAVVLDPVADPVEPIRRA